jgi:hypothetical protein
VVPQEKALMPMTNVSLDGKLTLSGLLEPQAHKVLSGKLSFVGTLTLTELTVVIINHSISFVGVVDKKITKTMVSSLGFIAILNKLTKRSITNNLKVEGTVDMTLNPPAPKHKIMSWFRRGHH